MQAKPHILPLPVYQPGLSIDYVKQTYHVSRITKLASNENPYGCSPNVQQAILAHVDQLHRYPDGGCTPLATALATRWEVHPNQLIFGAGSDEVVLMIARTFLSAQDETIMADRTFPQYKHNACVEGATVIEVPLQEGVHDLPAMLAAVTPKTKVVWVCNPNNPTGTIVTHEALDAFMQALPAHVLVVLDEAYAEYVVSEAYPHSRTLLQAYPNVLILRTFSKAYGLANVRLGYGVGSTAVIEAMEHVREPFNTTGIAQVAALAALEDETFLATCREKNEGGMKQLVAALQAWELDYFPAHGNFILLHTKRDARAVTQALLEQGVIVRGGHTASVRYPQHIRVTIGTADEMDHFMTVFARIISTGHG